MKITVPNNIRSFTTAYGSINYHIEFLYEDQFEAFCNANNIGYKPENRKDVIKSSQHIFSEDKTLFIHEDGTQVFY